MNKFKDLPEGAKKIIRRVPGQVTIHEGDSPHVKRLSVISEEIGKIKKWNFLCRLRHEGKIEEYFEWYIRDHQIRHGFIPKEKVKRKRKKRDTATGDLFADLDWEDHDE